MRSLALISVAACGLQAPAHAADPVQRAALHRQVDALFAPWSDAGSPGCVVGVAQAGVLDYARGYGLANLELGVANTPESVFWAASVSKQFTAFLVYSLARDGTVSLDDDIRKYLPELPDYGSKITLAHLLHHSSGLREQGQILYLAGWRSDDLKTQQDMLRIVARQHSLNYTPGAEVVYTNTGYMLAATIVERVSGMPFAVLANERIFTPLGMSATRFGDDHRKIVPGRATGYSQAEGVWRTDIPNFDHYGSTHLLTTVGDLLKWQQNLLDARVGGPAVITALRTSGRLNDGVAIGYGGGLRLASYRGLPTIGHDGLDAGYRANTLAFPEQKLAIAVLCNAGNAAPDELTRKIADLYLQGRLAARAVPPKIAVPEAEQAVLAGAYWSPLTDEVVRLEWRDGALRQVGAGPALVPIGGDAFRPGELAHVWKFSSPARTAPGETEPVELSITDFWPTSRIFSRVSDPLPTVPVMQEFAGQYRSDETEMVYTAALADGKLGLGWARQAPVVLQPIGGDRFVSNLGTVTFVRAVSGRITGMTISGRRLRRFFAQRL